MAYAALNSLCTTIRDLALSSRVSLSPTCEPFLPLAFEAANSLLNTMELLDGNIKSYSRKKVNALDERIKEAVWKFEDLLDSHLYHQIFPQSQILRGRTVIKVHLHKIRDDIESLTQMLEDFKREYIYELDHLSLEEEVDVGAGAGVGAGVKNCKMVGSFYALWAQIRRKLELKHSSDVISLVGMGGIGKTTLAKKIFDDPLSFTGFEFGCRAWVTVGRKWKPRKLKRDILVQLDPSQGGGEGDEGYNLNGVLKVKRCLIVLDDVWDNAVWYHLKGSLPTYYFDGRTLVLLTTRLRHVARSAEASIHTVELLSNDESWDLLRQRVFGEEGSCPPELEKAGKKIAEKCDGLPLMIVTVADLLVQAEMTEEYWESVAEKKNSPVFMTAYDRLCEVLFPSYEYLPQHLKPCFLHMGVYLQRCRIGTTKLLNMWIAEGFLLSYKKETIEECSERYLMDLFDHSVVMICERSNNCNVGGKSREIKACRLQSSLWYLCNREATNTKFFHVLSTLDDVEKSLNTQRRLSFHNNILFAINNISDFVGDVCASTARSLLLYGPYHPYPVPVCFNLRLLKVLDAFLARFYVFPALVFQLVYLRFLALNYNGKLPSSISRLWNLRFLIIDTNMIIKYSGVTSYMPMEIWHMKELKCLQVVGSNLPNPWYDDVSLRSLLRLKDVGIETCTRKVLERIPNLKKLGIRVDLHPGDDDDMKALHCLNHVHVLRELTSLKCTVLNPILRSEVVALRAPLPNLPFGLKKLHLSGMGYPWSYMSVIGLLPHLQVLKLRSYAFRGSEWVVKDYQFPRLNFLMIEGTDLVKFKVEVGGFSDLRVLFFSNCYKLRDIHIHWEPDQSSHVIISVTDCSTSTVAFANEYNSTRDSHIPEEHRSRYVFSSYMK